MPFRPSHALRVAGWVGSDQELRWLAPNTPPPLTADKVVRWARPDGTALVAVKAPGIEPVGYGEINAMKGEAARAAGTPGHLWMGHVVLAPELRGRGQGRSFVRSLLAHAFEALAADRVTLVVFPENRIAVRCYRSVGFSVVQEERHRFGVSPTHHTLVRLSLAASDYAGRIHE